jgi:hypothetical protein
MFFGQEDSYYTIGSVRIRRKFIFRKTINGETRYLQVAYWEEEYVHVYIASFDNYCEWQPVSWLSQKEFEKFDLNPKRVPAIG